MSFTSHEVFVEESRDSKKRALYKDVSRLLIETGDMRAISQTYWADCERFIFIMRPTFHDLKMSDSNKPSLGFCIPRLHQQQSIYEITH